MVGLFFLVVTVCSGVCTKRRSFYQLICSRTFRADHITQHVTLAPVSRAPEESTAALGAASPLCSRGSVVPIVLALAPQNMVAAQSHQNSDSPYRLRCVYCSVFFTVSLNSADSLRATAGSCSGVSSSG